MRSVHYEGYTFFEDGTIIGLHGRPLKIHLNKGRYEVGLVIDGERKKYLVARILYFAFNKFDISDKNLCVVSSDRDHTNIHLDNLELVHRKDLIHGEKHKGRAVLTDEQTEEIKGLYAGKSGANQYDKTGYSLNDLAKLYGVSKANIMHIVNGLSRDEASYKLK